ncbi:UNVERIFIED_CONTAM: hypothetical protein Sradi_3785100 [Sesamum radiatum]|uniref:Retrotransposon gag domain-containing protein n=1 Tax=Sesamum radiatum TaxID=300843 RepID=A0AAW2Q081_SESRA
MITSAIREQLTVLAPVQVTMQPDVVVPEQVDPTLVTPRREAVLGPAQQPPAQAGNVLPQWLARLESLQKGLLDVQYQVMGAPAEEQAGIPFTDEVMADELLVNCRIPAIAEYDGTTNPQEHLSRFENAALLHRYTDGTKCRVFFASSRKHRKTELSLFSIQQKERESLKDYLRRFNTATLEVPSATQEVKASTFVQGLRDGDFFKSLAKKPTTKFDVLLARVAKYINMEDA